jgi:hypothetical protein
MIPPGSGAPGCDTPLTIVLLLPGVVTISPPQKLRVLVMLLLLPQM